MIWAALVAASYLLGAVSFSLLIVRALRGIDIRTRGSGNAGATNVLRTAGAGPAIAVLLLDMAKGAVPVIAGRLLDAPGPAIGAMALAAVLGHVFPVYYGFRGGKGVATSGGALILLAPTAALLSVVAFAVVVLSTRYVSLASIVAAGAFPLAIVTAGRLGWTAPSPAWLVASSAAIAAIVIFMHRDNMKRLAAGTENRFGQHKEVD